MPRNERSPACPTIMPWDPQSWQAAMTAQTLALKGLLELPFDPLSFNALVGRKPGEYDLGAGCLRLLLNAGFEVLSRSPYDSERQANDISYVRTMLIEQGSSPEEVGAFSTTDHAIMRRYVTATRKVETAFPNQVTHEEKRAGWDDVLELLEKGYIVEVSHAGNRMGLRWPLLVINKVGEEDGISGYEMYDPGKGFIIQSIIPRFLDKLIPVVTGYRLTV